MKITVTGKMGSKTVDATWEDGDISGDPKLVDAMFKQAFKKPYVRAPEPDGLIPVDFSTPTSFEPLAREVLDKVLFVDRVPPAPRFAIH